MAELLKNIYNKTFFEKFTDIILKVKTDFNKASFIKHIYDDEWEFRELKQRMRHISLVLNKHLADDFEKNTTILLNSIPQLLKAGFKTDSLEFIFIPDFIELYGTDHYNMSVKALEQVTQFITCEFAVRPFIIKYEKQMMTQMLLWSKHQHASVRRLASEGCRPRLPWAMALPVLKKNPAPILPVLENLKNDVSEYVRRSVANNLNDISKDNPALVIDLIKRWRGNSKETDTITKHAARTLLKQGNAELMQLFGFSSVDNISITDFKVLTPTVKIGESLHFSFTLHNKANTLSKIRLEYAVYFHKANSSLSKKVFKISEKEYDKNSSTSVKRKQAFKIITTRRLHPGLHRVSIIINGIEFDILDFTLVN